jgi:hypothetical protein
MLVLALVPAVALSAAPAKKKLMTVRDVSSARVQLVPGARATIRIRGEGLSKVKSVAVVRRTRAGAYVPQKRLGARIVSKTSQLLVIELGAARAGALGTAGALAFGLTGVDGLFTLPETAFGVAVVPSGGRARGTAPGTGLLGTGSTGAAAGPAGASAGRPELGVGGATPSLTGPSTGRAPMTSSQKNPSSMAGTVWGGTTQSEEHESSDGTRSSQSTEFYSDEKGNRMTITTTESGGHVYQSVIEETTDGQVNESNSIDGEEVAGTPPAEEGGEEGGQTAEGGGTEGGDTEGGDATPAGDDTTDTVATPVDAGSGGSRQNPFRTMPDRSSPGATGGNIDPNPEGTTAGARPGGSAPTLGEARKALGKKGLGGDPGQPTSTTGAVNPAKVAPVAPNKGNIDPAPDAAGTPRTSPGAAGTPVSPRP